MLRAAFVFASLLFAPLPPQAPPAGGRPQAALDSEPSDAAAIGFLTTVVDQRVYSLESVGAARLTSKVKATFEVTDPLSKRPSQSLELDVSFDYATGATTCKPSPPPADLNLEQQKQRYEVVVLASSAAQNCFSLKPSRSANGWKVKFVQDGEAVRLDYSPRNPAGLVESFSEWLRLDGTPLRRRIVSRVPSNGVLTTATQEIAFDYEEVEKRLLLKELRPIETATARTGYRFEYLTREGLHCLSKVVQEETGWRLTLDFNTKVELAAKR